MARGKRRVRRRQKKGVPARKKVRHLARKVKHSRKKKQKRSKSVKPIRIPLKKPQKPLAPVKTPVSAARPPSFKSATITTNPDRLYRMVNEQGKVLLTTAARSFGVDIRLVEEWAHMLEDHKLIKIHYPTFGKPILVKIGENEEKGGMEGREGKEEKVVKPKRKGKKKTILKIAIPLILIIILLRQFILPEQISLAPLASQLTLTNLLILLVIIMVVMIILIIKKRKGRRHGR